MAPLKTKGDMAELIVAADLVKRGHRVAFPFGEDCDFDLLFWRPPSLAIERVQVKYTTSDGTVVVVRARSHSLTNGRIRATKHYTKETIDWLVAYDATTGRIFWVPAEELGSGASTLHLRLRPTRNGQRVGIRMADDYAMPTIDIEGP
jgi:hypothetical protein